MYNICISLSLVSMITRWLISGDSYTRLLEEIVVLFISLKKNSVYSIHIFLDLVCNDSLELGHTLGIYLIDIATDVKTTEFRLFFKPTILLGKNIGYSLLKVQLLILKTQWANNAMYDTVSGWHYVSYLLTDLFCINHTYYNVLLKS